MSNDPYFQDPNNIVDSEYQQEILEDLTYRVYYLKALPVLAIGMIIWIVSTLSLNSIALVFQTTTYIIITIAYFVLWTVTIVLARKKKNVAAMITFFITSYINGVIQSPIVLWGASVLGSYNQAKSIFLLAGVLGVVAVSAALSIGMIFKNQLTGKYLWVSLIGLSFLGLTELILSFIFGLSSGTWIYWTSAIYLALMMITIIYDGARLEDEIRYSWMLAVVSIFLDFVIVTVRIFIVLIQVFSDR